MNQKPDLNVRNAVVDTVQELEGNLTTQQRIFDGNHGDDVARDETEVDLCGVDLLWFFCEEPWSYF